MNEIVALYKFTNVKKPQHTQKVIKARLKELSVYGTILIGEEGINGTISADNPDALSQAISFIESIKGFKNLDLKFSHSIKKPFIRLKVKLKKEIVTIGDTSINPNKEVGEYVDPQDWNSLISQNDTLVIDTRNDYECSIGSFENSINPKTNKFRDFPSWLEDQKFTEKDKKNKKIAMFCTGGIRCEKASSLMKKNGFENVYHLKGGILKYLENIPEQESLWSGECFVFDERVAVNHQLDEGSYKMCHGCRMPITASEMKSSKYIRGVACPKCFDKTTDKQKLRYTSRQEQMDLAKKRNKKHIGPKEEVFN